MTIEDCLNEIERLAFDIPPPNKFTPRIISAVIVARACLYEQEKARRQFPDDGLRVLKDNKLVEFESFTPTMPQCRCGADSPAGNYLKPNATSRQRFMAQASPLFN